MTNLERAIAQRESLAQSILWVNYALTKNDLAKWSKQIETVKAACPELIQQYESARKRVERCEVRT